MINSLTIRTDDGDFDLFGNESIVQTLSIFNVEDISARTSDYSNEFNLPLTENNKRLVKYANFILAVNTLPYSKTDCDILVNGVPYKTGFIEITSISDSIKARFYTGNGNFYNIIKGQNINSYDWSSYNHNWGLLEAVAAAKNTSGYIYPIINYSGNNTPLYMDVRKLLPSTFDRTIVEKICSENGYSVDYQFDTVDFFRAITPFSGKNLVYPSEYLDLNSVSAQNTAPYGYHIDIPITYDKRVITDQFINFSQQADVGIKNQYNTFTPGTSTYWDSANNIFVANVSGIYTYSLFVDFVNYNSYTITGVEPGVVYPGGAPPGVLMQTFKSLVTIIIVSGSQETAIDSAEVGPGGATLSGSVFLKQGDYFKSTYGQFGVVAFVLTGLAIGVGTGTFNVAIDPQIKVSNSLSITLNQNLNFGGLIDYNLIVPSIKSSDFIKDMCIRFGLIISINEDTKTVSFRKFEDVISNLSNFDDWSDKLDKTDTDTLEFKFDTYAQSNSFKHKFDKSILATPPGSDYNLIINNSNLELQKDLYISPFAASESDNVLAGSGRICALINSYDFLKSTFSNDTEPRKLFIRTLSGVTFSYGANDPGVGLAINVVDPRVAYFIDNTQSSSMGFGSNLISRNSKSLIEILQDPKILTCNIKLSTIDIKNLDFFKPKYIKKYQCYFFLSSVNQYNYTNSQSTTVELIKLNA